MIPLTNFNRFWNRHSCQSKLISLFGPSRELFCGGKTEKKKSNCIIYHSFSTSNNVKVPSNKSGKILFNKEHLEEVEQLLKHSIDSKNVTNLLNLLRQIGTEKNIPLQLSNDIFDLMLTTSTWDDFRKFTYYLPPDRELLKLSTGYLQDIISHCMNGKHLDEALHWFYRGQYLNIKISRKTYMKLVPYLAKQKSWDTLYYILSEMKLSDFPVPNHLLDIMIRNCATNPKSRWSAAVSFTELFQSRMSTQGLVDGSSPFSLGTSSKFYELLSITLEILLEAERPEEALQLWKKLSVHTDIIQNPRLLIALGTLTIERGLTEDLIQILDITRSSSGSTLAAAAGSEATTSTTSPPALPPAAVADHSTDRGASSSSSSGSSSSTRVIELLRSYVSLTSENNTDSTAATTTTANYRSPVVPVVRLGIGLAYLLTAGCEDTAKEIWEAVGRDNHPDTFRVLVRCVDKSRLSPRGLEVVGMLAKSFYQDQQVIKQSENGTAPTASPTASPAAARPKSLPIKMNNTSVTTTYSGITCLGENDLSSDIMSVFGLTQDVDAAVSLLLLSGLQDDRFDEQSFRIISHMMSQAGRHRDVVDLLDLYLFKHDSYIKEKKRSLQQKFNASKRNTTASSLGATSGAKTSKTAASKPADASGDLASLDDVDISDVVDTRKRGPTLTAMTFAPALVSLSKMGEVNTLMTVLHRDMPVRGIRPKVSLIVTVINALREAGRYEDGWLLFLRVATKDILLVESCNGHRMQSKLRVWSPKAYLPTLVTLKEPAASASPSPSPPTPPPPAIDVTQTTVTGSGHTVGGGECEDVSSNSSRSGSTTSSSDSRERLRDSEGRLTRTPNKSLFVDAAIVKTVLRCCAEGRLAREALELLVKLDQMEYFATSSGDELRIMESVAMSLSSRENAAMLPSLLAVMGNRGRSLAATRRLLLVCLGSALSIVLTSDSPGEAAAADVARELLQLTRTSAIATDLQFYGDALALAKQQLASEADDESQYFSPQDLIRSLESSLSSDLLTDAIDAHKLITFLDSNDHRIREEEYSK